MLDRCAACLGRDYVTELAHGHFLISKDITLACHTLIRSSDHTICQVSDVAQVKGSLHTHRHISVDDTDDGSGRLADGEIIWSKDSAWMNNAGI